MDNAGLSLAKANRTGQLGGIPFAVENILARLRSDWPDPVTVSSSARLIHFQPAVICSSSRRTPSGRSQP